MKLVEYRKIAKSVADDVEAALAKHGLKMRPFGAKIDERLGVVRMTIESVDVNHKAADGSATTPEREHYKERAALYDMKPEWLGQTFMMNGSEYTVNGLLRSSRKNPVEIKRGDGKVYLASPEQIQRAFLAKEAAAGTPKAKVA